MKKVLFIVDVDSRVGLGHISRCIMLAKTLKRLKIEPYFLIKKESKIIKMLNDLGFCFFILPKKDKRTLLTIFKIYKKTKFSCVIIDVRDNISQTVIKKMKQISKVVIIGNNTNPNNFTANLVIWPEIKEQYPNNIILSKPKNLLVGNNYVLLGNIRSSKKIRRGTNRILVSMGGTDKRHLTEKIIKSFKKHKHNFCVDIVTTKFYKNTKKIMDLVKNDSRFTLIQNQNNLIPLMQRSTLGIFTFGITAYESFYCGLPTITVSHSKENDRAAKKMSPYHCMYYLGYYDNVEFINIAKTAIKLSNDYGLARELSYNGKKLVDGNGAQRIALIIRKMI